MTVTGNKAMNKFLKTTLLICTATLLFACNSSPTTSVDSPSTNSGNETMSDIKNVTFKTTQGSFTLELYPEKAPETVANFLEYVNSGYYEGTIFHRVIPGFMAQGGGFAPDMTQKDTNAPIKNEANNGLKNDDGTIAMARTGDPHSATAQFFINVQDNDFLNFSAETQQGWGYAVFGKVTEGLDVVHGMVKVATTNAGPHQNVPAEPIIIESATVVE